VAVQNKPINRLIALGLFAVGSAGLFILDISNPPGIADGVGYAPLLVLCLWIGRQRAIYRGAFILTVLTISAEGFMHGVEIGNLNLVNRLIGLISIWTITAILIQRVKVEEYAKAAAISATKQAAQKQHFLSIMTHELRSPLNAIVGFSEVLTRDPVIKERRQLEEYVSAIYTSAMNLLEQVNDFLDFSKLEAGHQQPILEPMNVKILIDDAVIGLKHFARGAGIHIKVENAANLPPIFADGRMTLQCIVNLITNAIKFTDPPGEVAIRSFLENGHVVVSISDTGIGIPASDIPRLGAPFVQIRTKGDRARPGTGLGLSITKAFMDLQQGSMRIESIVGKGTTVHLSFRTATES